MSTPDNDHTIQYNTKIELITCRLVQAKKESEYNPTSIASNIFDSLWNFSTTFRRRRNLLFQFRLQIFRRRVGIFRHFFLCCFYFFLKVHVNFSSVFSDVRYMLSPVRLSSVCLSVTFVRPTQPVEIFSNFSSPFGTLAIRWHPRKILRRSFQGNPSVRGFKCIRGSQI